MESTPYMYLIMVDLQDCTSVRGEEIVDEAPSLGLNKITGGRAVVAGHILSKQMDIFASNERGPNFI